MLFNLHFHITTNVAVNFQYLQSQAQDLKFAWSCYKDKTDFQNPNTLLGSDFKSVSVFNMFLNTFICFYLFFPELLI